MQTSTTHSPMQRAILDLETVFGLEHNGYTRECHAAEVECGDTRLWDYWEWVVHQIEADGGSVDAECEIQAGWNLVSREPAGALLLDVQRTLML